MGSGLIRMADGDRLQVNPDMVDTFERVYFGGPLNVGVRQALQAVFDEFNLSAGAAAGDRLDAERRGERVTCLLCPHPAHELTCLFAVGPSDQDRCGCSHRKSEQGPT